MRLVILSIKVFGAYLLLTGLALLIAPAVLLDILIIDQSPNIWMQLLGLALSVLAFYYLKAANDKNIDFIKGTVPIRFFQLIPVSGLVWIYEGPYVLIVISIVETISALWTYIALKQK